MSHTPESLRARFLADVDQDLPLSATVAAHAGTSWTPERRGETEQRQYAETLARDLDAMAAHAAKAGTFDVLDSYFPRYREGLRRRYRAWLSARSRVLSAGIAGPSNFPVRRMERRGAVADGRARTLDEWRKTALDTMRTALRPDMRPIMAGDLDAGDRLRAKIAESETMRDRMKARNAIIRAGKGDHDATMRALVAAGCSPTVAAELLVPNYRNDVGYESWQLSNLGANIRRMKERLAQVEAAKAAPVTETEGASARVEEDPPANRVRIFFPSKPDAETRATLKRNGFRWSPTAGAWQAYLNARTVQVAQAYLRS